MSDVRFNNWNVSFIITNLLLNGAYAYILEVSLKCCLFFCLHVEANTFNLLYICLPEKETVKSKILVIVYLEKAG